MIPPRRTVCQCADDLNPIKRIGKLRSITPGGSTSPQQRTTNEWRNFRRKVPQPLLAFERDHDACAGHENAQVEVGLKKGLDITNSQVPHDTMGFSPIEMIEWRDWRLLRLLCVALWCALAAALPLDERDCRPCVGLSTDARSFGRVAKRVFYLGPRILCTLGTTNQK
jgi:hypothetical protein